MPELPDLVRVESELRRAVLGRRIVGARTGDPLVLRVMVAEPFPALLIGRRLEDIVRRGHFMRFGLQGDLDLVINAMLVGRYVLVATPANAAAADRKKDPQSLGLALEFEGGVELRYLDDKRMGKVYVARPAQEGDIPAYRDLGVDILSDAFTLDAFRALVRGRRDQARVFLMDKRAIASIGNAYADEILFAARVHPKTFCHKLAPAEADALFHATGEVMRRAIDEIARRGEPIHIKVRDFLSVRGRDRKPCPRCGTTIRKVRVAGWDSCFCPSCQPTSRKLFVDWSQVGGLRAPGVKAQRRRG